VSRKGLFTEPTSGNLSEGATFIAADRGRLGNTISPVVNEIAQMVALVHVSEGRQLPLFPTSSHDNLKVCINFSIMRQQDWKSCNASNRSCLPL
jgi:hypothetical protein